LVLLPNSEGLVYPRIGLPVSVANVFGAVIGASLLLTATGEARAEPSTRPPELGYNYSEVETARAAAMGGALRAFSNSTEAININPANLAATRVYHMGGLAQFWSGANRQSYGVSIVDSVVSRSRLAGGLSASWLFQDPDGLDRTALDLRFALAFPLSDRFLIGATGRLLDLKQGGFPRGQRLLPPSLASSGLKDESIVKDITFDAGMTIRPAAGLALSLVGYNLTDPGHSLLPLTVGGGVGYGSRMFTLEADVVGDFTTYDETKVRAMGGAEFLMANQYPLRFGYRYDQGQDNHAICGGAGYTSREFSFDVGVRRVLGANSSTALFIGLKYHVESLGIAGQ
jgi:hypothetical protein